MWIDRRNGADFREFWGGIAGHILQDAAEIAGVSARMVSRLFRVQGTTPIGPQRNHANRMKSTARLASRRAVASPPAVASFEAPPWKQWHMGRTQSTDTLELFTHFQELCDFERHYFIALLKEHGYLKAIEKETREAIEEVREEIDRLEREKEGLKLMIADLEGTPERKRSIRRKSCRTKDKNQIAQLRAEGKSWPEIAKTINEANRRHGLHLKPVTPDSVRMMFNRLDRKS